MANTNAGSKFYVCAIAQNSILDVGGYNALDWTEVGGSGNIGESGIATNMLNYDTWGDSVTQKAKGLTDAGSPDLEVERRPADAGQEILRTAGAVGNNNNYAFKIVKADNVVGGIGSIFYNRGLVSGPKRPNGRNEDFDLEIFTLGFQQEEIPVDPTAGGNAPVLTVAPVVSGTETVGETLTCSTGTFTGDATIVYTYQWFLNGVAVTDSTETTYVLSASDEGKVLMCRVMATNDSGHAFGFSNTTGAIQPIV